MIYISHQIVSSFRDLHVILDCVILHLILDCVSSLYDLHLTLDCVSSLYDFTSY